MKVFSLLRGGAFWSSVIATIVPRHEYDGPTVETKNGTYGGAYIPTYHQDVFLGIRYAQVSRLMD